MVRRPDCPSRPPSRFQSRGYFLKRLTASPPNVLRVENEAFAKSLSDLVGKLEKRSSSEIVVVLAGQSGSYQDVEHVLAFAGSLSCLLYLIHSPIEFKTDLWVVWLVLAYLLTLALVKRFPALRRPFTSEARRRAQTVTAARTAFVEERITSTRERTGLLVYISRFEGQLALLGDLAIDAKIPQSLFHVAEKKVAEASSWSVRQGVLLEQLASLEEPLAQALPVSAEDVNELDNEVRVRG